MQRRKHCIATQGFTLIELLVTLALMSLLASLLLPVLSKARDTARAAVCGSNLRQMTLALTMYTDDNRGRFFPEWEELPDGRLWWFGFEADSGPTTEGDRILDRTRGRLWRYYQMTDSIEICPSFPSGSGNYKPKFTTNWTTYGLPQPLLKSGDVRLHEIRWPSDTLAFADTAFINSFQPPASPSRPMFEQWHYITGGASHVLYSHGQRALATMLDGHVQTLAPQFGVSPLFPEAPIGRPPSNVLLRP